MEPKVTNKEIRELLRVAKKARKNAYAPYSKYKVGAAVLDNKGRMWAGCNIENISFSETLHAEEVAIANAIVNNKKIKLKAIAVVTKNKKDNKNPWPCSHCRQVMGEFGLGLLVITQDKKGRAKVKTLKELVPFPFCPEKYRKI